MKMVRYLAVLLVLLISLSGQASAQSRFIVRDTLGEGAINLVCALLGCQVNGSLGDPQGQLFSVTGPLGSTLSFANLLLGQLGIVSVEVDQVVQVSQSTSPTVNIAALNDHSPVNYYGATLWNAYVNQPAAAIVRSANAHSTYNVAGSGIVAIIDTGLDPTNPMFQNVVVNGYDFTRNQSGIPNEVWDLSANDQASTSGTTAAVLEGNGSATELSGTTAAVLEGTTAAVLENAQYKAFGHGTVVAGVVHLIAPTAQLMPLKAFKADGSSNLSDIIHAVYYAWSHHARVINMSFCFSTRSQEMYIALKLANLNGVISVAAAGNDGKQEVVYPAGYTDVVMGVASTNTQDQLSSFSNYGSQVVFVAAPGENVVSAYPFGTYAVASGTSFASPMVAGAAALLQSVRTANEGQAANAVAHAVYINPFLNHGRLDLVHALQAWVY